MVEIAEQRRLEEDQRREKNWKRWGPYLSERQWGTVREDYSAEGESWSDLSHDASRSRAYRWGEDGLLGLTDRRCRLCFALALWNQKDAILKERLFGLTGPEGNHGEDVKELYYYLDATPTYSYAKSLYKYPQAAFPYGQLKSENANRDKSAPEFEITDTGVFNEDRYFDVYAEYAKADANDILIRITVHNRGPDAAPIRVIPTVWFRNTWAWGRTGDGYWPEPEIRPAPDAGPNHLDLKHYSSISNYRFCAERVPDDVMFTCNETNQVRLYGAEPNGSFVKDAFHEAIVDGRREALNPKQEGTKAGMHYAFELPADGRAVLRFRLTAASAVSATPFDGFDGLFHTRIQEADAFYDSVIPNGLADEEKQVARQAYAGLLHTNQFYHLIVRHWLDGDPTQPSPSRNGSQSAERNKDWRHLCSISTCCRCPINGSTRGTRRGTSPFIWCPTPTWIRTLPRDQLQLLVARMVHASERPDSRLRVRSSTT